MADINLDVFDDVDLSGFDDPEAELQALREGKPAKFVAGGVGPRVTTGSL